MGLILGMVAANVIFKDYLDQVGLLGDIFLQKYRYTEIDGPSLLVYLCKTRLPAVLILIGAGCTGLGVFFAALYCGWMGFSAGMLFAMATIQKGLSGMVVVLAALLPQYLAYIPGMLLIFYGIMNRRRRLQNGHNHRGVNLQYAILAVLALAVLIAGILSETYVNPIFVKKILKNY